MSFSLKAFAHRDTMDGPVVKDAQAALEKGDVTPVLKWVKKDAEPEVRSAFQTALAERIKNPQNKVTNKDLQGLFKISAQAVHKELAKLVNLKVIKPVGEGRALHYILI